MTVNELKQLVKEAIDSELDSPQGHSAMKSIHHSNLKRNLTDFTRQYIETALWSSTDNLTYNHGEKDQFDPEYDEDEPSGVEDTGGEPLDKNYTLDDIDPGTVEEMAKDCKSFYDKFNELYHSAGWADDRAAHDFWLTRNGHGAGFWDKNQDDLDQELNGNMSNEQFEDAREVLAKGARSFGPYSLYLGDGQYDGVIFGMRG